MADLCRCDTSTTGTYQVIVRTSDARYGVPLDAKFTYPLGVFINKRGSTLTVGFHLVDTRPPAGGDGDAGAAGVTVKKSS